MYTRPAIHNRWRSASQPLLFIVLMAALLAGCAHPFTPVPNPMEIDPSEYRRVFNSSVESLRDLGFRVDRHDYRFGRITTRPQTSPTIGEFWTTTNTTADLALQSTLHHLRRRITIFFDPFTDPASNSSPPTPRLTAGDQDTYNLRVEVVLEKRQTPRDHLTGSTRGHEIKSQLHALPAEWAAHKPSAFPEWLPIGRDPDLEQRLLNDIIRRSLRISSP